jgi:hypothetical protein
MAPSNSIDLAIFVINAAFKATEQLKKGYANHLIGKAITIPLPNYDPTIKETTIEFFFNREGKSYIDDLEDLRLLHTKASTGNLNEHELERYRQYYAAFQENQETHFAIFKLKQWQNSAKPTSLFQLLAGQLVAITTDYFQKYPIQNSSLSLTIKSFFEGLEKIPFEMGNFDRRKIAQVVIPHLFLGTAEYLNQTDHNLQFHPHARNIISEITNGVGKYLLNHPASETSTEWGKIIWFAVAKNATESGISKIQLPLISEMATLLLQSITNEKETSFAIPTQIEPIVKNILYVLSKHPNLYAIPGGFQSWMSELLHFISKTPLQTHQIRPLIEIAASTAIEESNLKKNTGYTTSILQHISNSTPIPDYSYTIATLFLQGLDFYIKTSKEPWPDFILKNFLQKWTKLENHFKSTNPQLEESFIITIVQYYQNQIYSQPITPGNSLKIMDHIAKKLNTLPKPFPQLTEEKLIFLLNQP